MNSRKRASLSSNSPLDQLFAPSREREQGAPEEEPAPEHASPVGRSPQQSPSASFIEEPTTEAQETERELRQTTIMIYDDQADWLDEACYLARRESGSVISKAAILRELVDMARQDPEIRAQLRQRLGLGA